MINPKNICICACIGFFLSFFIGLVSPGVNFSHVILRAFLFALLFAVLCVGVSFLYQKFLSNADNNSFGEPESAVRTPASGSVINIVVDDATLPDDGMSPKFNVSPKHVSSMPKEAPQMQNAPVSQTPQAESSETKSSETVMESEKSSVSELPNEASSQPAPSFKPMGLESVASPVSGNSEGEEPSSEKLDELPDMGTLDTIAAQSEDAESMIDSDSSPEIVSDTEFATGGKHLKEQPISGDTNVMAKAIQTLLAKDNS